MISSQSQCFEILKYNNNLLVIEIGLKKNPEWGQDSKIFKKKTYLAMNIIFITIIIINCIVLKCLPNIVMNITV